MRLGVVFPQTEIGADPAVIRDYAQAAESLGYDHILAYEHVLGANRATHAHLSGPYRHNDAFHEPFVLFGFLAAMTRTIELATGIMILPQRQTVLVAKQAAEVDVLSGGRLRLGVGVGWNPMEYEALGMGFEKRGGRIAEQIEVMRALWTQELVSFKGKHHSISDAGINPLPVQRPIPVWMGGGAESVLRRIGRISDGWVIPGRSATPNDQVKAMVHQVHRHARDAGRDPAALGLEKVLFAGHNDDDTLADLVQSWKEFGATHISVNTMGMGLERPDDHIEQIKRFIGIAKRS